jgi:hypothetical protein
MGLLYQPPESRWAWSIGGMIIGRGIPKYSKKNLLHCHFIHHKSDMDSPGIEPEPLR